MRIAQFVNTLSVTDGGPARNSFELNQALNAIGGVEAHLFWFHGSEDDTTCSEDRRVGRAIREPHPTRLRFRSGAKRSIAAIRGSDIVVVHGFYLWWVPFVGLAARILQTPVAVMPHGSISRFEKRRSHIAKQIFDRLVIRCVGRGLSFATGSESEAADVRIIFPGIAVSVAGVGARLMVEPRPRGARQARSDELVLLSLSRIASKKRIDLMIGATAELVRMGVPSRLLVAGAGDSTYLHRLRELARSLGIDDRVEFVGLADNAKKSELYGRAHVFLLPSDDENFGIGLAEALSAGIPSVTSDRVAAAHLVSDEGRTMLTNPTASTIARASAAYAAPDVWQRASEAARRDADRAYSWDAVAERWREILDARVDGGSAGRSLS